MTMVVSFFVPIICTSKYRNSVERDYTLAKTSANDVKNRMAYGGKYDKRTIKSFRFN